MLKILIQEQVKKFHFVLLKVIFSTQKLSKFLSAKKTFLK